MSEIALRIINGTPSSSDPRLCDSCGDGIVMKNDADGSERIFCRDQRREVHLKVTKCSAYEDKSRPSLWDMRRTAWILQTDSRRQAIGFVTPRKWREKNDEDDLLPSHLS